jgi:hypothetical protein
MTISEDDLDSLGHRQDADILSFSTMHVEAAGLRADVGKWIAI